MIAIKLSADNVRLIRAAKSEPELRGAIDLVLERLDQAETLKKLGKEVQLKAEKKYNWTQARDVMGAVLGADLKYPPFPDPIWYQRVHRNMKMHDMGEKELTELAEYAKANLRPPYSLDFLVSQRDRILLGNFDKAPKKGANTDASYLLANWNKLPEE